VISTTMSFAGAIEAAAMGVQLEILHVHEGKPQWWEPFTLRPDTHVVVWMLSAKFRIALDWPECGCKERGASPTHVHRIEPGDAP
jgi:hypothetical protein